MSDANAAGKREHQECKHDHNPDPEPKKQRVERAVELVPEVKAVEALMVRDRRHFHRHPELSFKEFETAKYIVEQLRAIDGVEHITEKVGQTGVTAMIRGGAGQGPCLALRADMDALPITEATGLEFASANEGVHHACGHDGHMASLLGTARVLAAERASLRGSVKLVFQPAEEGYGGAREMIKDGVLDGVDEVYGIHLWTYGPVGHVLVKDGPLMAASDLFEIEVIGTGGHGAVPQGTHDAIVASASLVTQLHTIVARNVGPIDSAVMTIGQINGGFNYNVIADRVKLRGTVRTLLGTTRDTVIRRMNEICDGVAKSFDLKVELDYQAGYPATTMRSPEHVQHVRDAARRVVGAEGVIETEPTMAAEDFSYFLLQRPGCFFFVGASPVGPGEEVVPHHKPNFTVDERSLGVSASCFVNLVRDRLGAKAGQA